MPKQLESKTMNDVSVEVIESWKRALAELVEIAHNDKIWDFIRLYDPEKPTKDNKKSLKSCRKDSIIETLNFLSKALNEGINKDNAIEKLCMKIQNFFPDFCQVCEQSYIVKYEDKHSWNVVHVVRKYTVHVTWNFLKVWTCSMKMKKWQLHSTEYLKCITYVHHARTQQ